MHLEPLSFNALLNHVGQTFLWSSAYACPCLRPHSGASDPACPNCHGKGRVWSAPVEGVAGVANAKVQREWAQFGVWEQGDVVLTLPSDSPLYAMNQFDKVLMVNGSSPFSLVIDGLAGNVLPVEGAMIDRVFWLDPSTKAIVDGGIPAVSGTGLMTWASGAPPAGVQFSVTGRKASAYFCFGEFAQDRSHHFGRSLPRRCVLRKFDLFGRV